MFAGFSRAAAFAVMRCMGSMPSKIRVIVQKCLDEVGQTDPPFFGQIIGFPFLLKRDSQSEGARGFSWRIAVLGLLPKL
jgi:hypothetical protein